MVTSGLHKFTLVKNCVLAIGINLIVSTCSCYYTRKNTSDEATFTICI